DRSHGVRRRRLLPQRRAAWTLGGPVQPRARRRHARLVPSGQLQLRSHRVSKPHLRPRAQRPWSGFGADHPFSAPGHRRPETLAGRLHAARALRDPPPRQRQKLPGARCAATRLARRQVMPESLEHGLDCSCCAGIDAETPQPVDNPPGLSAITHRAGSYGDYLESLQARLSSSEYPALLTLSTREQQDFTLALCDALASSLEVLSFYTERYANEHFLRTARERLSVLELARLIGYRLSPGVAASTHLAFKVLG